MKKFDLTDWVRVAMYAALYTALTIVFAPISYYSIQFRISNALLAAVFLDPAAIFGVTFGLIIAGLYGGLGVFDFLVIPILSIPMYYMVWRYCKNYWQAVLVATIFDVLVIGPIVFSLIGLSWYLGSFWLSLGDLGVWVILGYPLYKGLRKIYKQRGISDK